MAPKTKTSKAGGGAAAPKDSKKPAAPSATAVGKHLRVHVRMGLLDRFLKHRTPGKRRHRQQTAIALGVAVEALLQRAAASTEKTFATLNCKKKRVHVKELLACLLEDAELSAVLGVHSLVVAGHPVQQSAAEVRRRRHKSRRSDDNADTDSDKEVTAM